MIVTDARLRGRAGTWDLTITDGVFRTIAPHEPDGPAPSAAGATGATEATEDAASARTWSTPADA